MPWLMLAAAMRVIAYGGGVAAIPATAIADICTLLAFIICARRSIEIFAGQTGLGTLSFRQEVSLCFSITKRVGVVMVIAAISAALAGESRIAPHLMMGLDGMAFDQYTHIGRFWSALVATLVLLMVVNAESNGGKASLRAALSELRKRWLWMLAAILVLGIANVCLSAVQGGVRSIIWDYWRNTDDAQAAKNLVYFVFIFGFATARLWLTLLILTYGLKQSYISEQQQAPE